MLLTVVKKTYRPKTPRPQRKSFFGELGALCPSTLLLSFESLRTVSHSNGRTTPLRETQFFRSLFHPKFQISLASILRSRYFIWWPWIDAHLKRDNKQRGGGLVMNVLLIEPILDRYVAQAERREKDWSPKEVAAFLLKLRKEILDCLK
jgi:hypothetical protein